MLMEKAEGELPGQRLHLQTRRKVRVWRKVAEPCSFVRYEP
jgi:hypothetical protein